MGDKWPRWTLKSLCFHVFIAALFLKAVTCTWNNFRVADVTYYRNLALECRRTSSREENFAQHLYGEADSKRGHDPETWKASRKDASMSAASARLYSLWADLLQNRAARCESSYFGWVVCEYHFLKSPPPRVFTVRGFTGRIPNQNFLAGNPVAMALINHPIVVTLGKVSYFWFSCLIVAFLCRRRWSKPSWRRS